MPYIRDRVFILRNESIREQDVRVSMYGMNHGKLVGIARGHRRPAGKQLGHMEPLTVAEVMIAEGKQYDKIAVAHLVEPYYSLHKNLPKVVILSSCLSLADMLTRPGIADMRVYRHMEELFEGLSHLREDPSSERAQLFYSWFALRLFGFFGTVASFSSCVVCRDKESDQMFLSPEMGGLICERCRGDSAKQLEKVSPLARKLLRLLQNASCEDVASISAPRQFFREANGCVSALLAFTPADGEPHGYKTISSVLA